MADDVRLAEAVKATARRAGADLVGIAAIGRFDNAPPELNPRAIMSATRSVIAIGLRILRGTLKTIEDGTYWQGYNCSSYQHLNEVAAPRILREVVLLLEDHGYTSVPVHNPFGADMGRPVRAGGVRPDGHISLRMVGCAAGLGELGRSKLFLSPQFGPRQRMFAVVTDAPLASDPLFTGSICADCGACARACPAGAIGDARSVELPIESRVFRHAPFNCDACVPVHQGWDPQYSPFLDENSSRENPPGYYRFLDHRFRHRSICGGRGCMRACIDHLEKTGRITAKYAAPMIEGEQWRIGQEAENSER
ncbi:MAG TPA: hypothetical protein VM186_13715 [Planctomycetota bacterium]|nr:hypothetical protein [Planctomycetota bacterium]